MPVTKTAKRALRGSLRKKEINRKIVSALEISLRVAKKDKKESSIRKAMSRADIAAKKKVIHKNKAAHIKSSLSKLLPQDSKPLKKTSDSKKTSTSGRKK